MQSSLMLLSSINIIFNKCYTFYLNSESIWKLAQYFRTDIFSFSFNDYLGYFYNYNSLHSFKYLGSLNTNTLVRMLSSVFDTKIKYARAFGSAAKILSFNIFRGIYTIALPSSFNKIFFTLTLSIPLENNNLNVKSDISYKNAGFWRKNGFRPIVRGVAMNPVDHPHGGRTKSIKLPRTPWGLITKLK